MHHPAKHGYLLYVFMYELGNILKMPYVSLRGLFVGANNIVKTFGRKKEKFLKKM